jgi:crossover junction endodeoxyribonuclease RuvC
VKISQNEGEWSGVRILGIDPGTVNTGWGVIEEHGSRLCHVAHGVIRCRGDLPQRLQRIFREASEIVTTYCPQGVSLEKSFVGDNIQTAFRLGEARGVIMVAVGSSGIPISEYSPAEIKVAVAGSGRATKEQMQSMVVRLLRLTENPATDAADALGAAICHLHTARFTARVATGRE